MKKLIALVLALTCVLSMVGCSSNREEVITLSFHGEHEYFVISNGSIVLSDKEDVFNGGNLEITQSGVFETVASYSAKFYTLTDGEQRTILFRYVIHQTGGAVNVDGDLGGISGESLMGDEVKSADDLKENLWFELKTTDLDGKENVYQIQLTLTD